jgi:hypothetical protein
VFQLYDFPRQSPSSNYPTTIYDKGAAVVGLLRYELGDSLFFQSMREYLQQHAYSVTTTDTLKAFLENKSGRDLKWFFDQWVYGKGYPVYKINIDKMLNSRIGLWKVNINIKQVQSKMYGAYTGVPFQIGFKGNDGLYFYRMIRIDSVDQTFSLDSLPEFTQISYNQGPDVRVLLSISSATITDIAENEMQPEVYCYPNPASDYVNFVLCNLSGPGLITICDNLGNIVYRKDIREFAGLNDMKLETGNYGTGLYFARIICADKTYSYKINIIH